MRTNEFLRIEPNEPVREELWLRPGDVLFPNRGTRTTALAFQLDRSRIIVGPQFFVIRPDRQAILAEYLAWFLRSPEAAAHFETRRKGTYVQIIQRSDVAELEIPLPPLAEQRLIVQISALVCEERELTERLLVLKSKHVNEQLLRAARKVYQAPKP